MIDRQLKFCARDYLKSLASLFLAGLFAVAGCGGDESSVDDGPSDVRIFAEDRSEPVEGAKVRITHPENEAMDAAEGRVVLEVSGLELGAQTQSPRAAEIANSADGQHVHLIVNNEPYRAVYKAGGWVKLDGLSPDLYTVFAFPSRSYHESFKNPGASDLVNFCVPDPQGNCIQKDFDVRQNGAAIFYSRPKGEYSGADAKKIMLDFYLYNLELSEDGYRARYTVTRKDEPGRRWSIVLDEWKPAFITGLETGTYVVRLDLIDGDGRIVEVLDVTYNETEREIKVVAE